MPLYDNYVKNPEIRGDFSPGVASPIESSMSHNLNWVHFRRAYLDKNGKPSVTVNTGRWTTEKGEKVPLKQRHAVMDLLNKGWNVPVFLLNATSMRKDDWIHLDSVVQKAYRARLRMVGDLMDAVPYGGFNGMSKMTLEYEAMSDPGEAVVDMDALGEARGDQPMFKLRSLPLPVTHSDFWYSERRLSVSRNSDTPLDTVSSEAAGRRIGEMIEKTTIGTETGISFGTRSSGYQAHDLNSTVYGMMNYTNRNTKTNFTAPTAGGWVANTTYNEILSALETLRQDNIYGPFVIYNSTDWDPYLDQVFSITGGNNNGETLRSMLKKIPDIKDVRRLDFATPAALGSTFNLWMVSMTSDVIQFVNGMDITTVMWETHGGMKKNYKVMAIQAPLFRSDFSGKCGILHGTIA